ncbi:uncharacterized protein KIAA2012-like [Sorghum bicolor]|uniref:uncharacterized protein KIAA2012-like n=1 Tax=Sorghum bicolor TaxID=4558 RepID=UPI000B423816|nr:uncharacterized protein KIAA2012-like [Sorghum bicolor]|eukprot:XP_021321316.1 uncharacterized protein KIAA2012-like [Sorghum bicolor]
MASDVDLGNVTGHRTAEPAAVVENAAEQTTQEPTEEQPAAVTVAETVEEDSAQARIRASTSVRDDEAARTPPPSSVAEEGDRAPTPLPAEERRAPTPPRRRLLRQRAPLVGVRVLWDHFIGHEELAETEEAARVERAAKRLVEEVKGAMKTVKYRKRCFDQIEGIVAEKKALTAEVDRLRSEGEEKAAEAADQEERLLDLNRRLADKDREKKDLEEEIERLRGERERLDQERTGALEAGRQAGEELRNKSRELAVLKVNTKKHLNELVKDRDSWKTNCIKI